MKILQHNILWAHGARPEYALDEIPHGDQWYIPTRVLPLVRPNKDLIVLPRRKEVEEFAQFVQKTLNVCPDQIIWTSGKSFLLDEDIPAILPLIKARIRKRDYQIVPYSTIPQLTEWTNYLWINNIIERRDIFTDSEDFVRIYGNKGILHEVPYTGDAWMQDIEFAENGLLTAPGFLCRDMQELQRAFGILSPSPSLIKPIFGSAGEGIFLATKYVVSEYKFPLGPVVLEKLLEIDRDGEGNLITCSVQSNGRYLFGPLTDQLMHAFEWAGNITPSQTTPEFQEKARVAARNVLWWLAKAGLRGPGGFDFLSVEGEPVMVDVNIGRFTGAHNPKIFQTLYVPPNYGRTMMNWKVTPPPEKSVFAWWESIEKKGIAFSPGKSSGIFPLCYLPGIWAMIMAFGESRAEVIKLRDRAMECF